MATAPARSTYPFQLHSSTTTPVILRPHLSFHEEADTVRVIKDVYVVETEEFFHLMSQVDVISNVAPRLLLVVRYKDMCIFYLSNY